MEDLSQKLAEILNNPESMNRVKQMAENLLGGEQKPDAIENSSDAGELKIMMNLISKFKQQSNDPRSNLLLSLKPHLSEPRREKVDTAIKILKLIEIFPLIKESGLFKL